MNNRNIQILVLALFASIALAVSHEDAVAQDVVVEGPLANQPAVRSMRAYRDMRFQLQPTASFTLQDQYSTAFQLGIEAHFHFTDWLGIGGFFNYSVGQINTSLTNQIQEKGVSGPRNRLSLPAATTLSDGSVRGGAADFDEQIGRLDWAAGLQLDFIPFRGKLAFFQKLFVDTDLHFFVGAALVQVTERADASIQQFGLGGTTGFDLAPNQDGNCSNPDDGGGDDAAALQCLAESQLERESRIAIAPTFGFGLTLYFNDWVGLNLQWRAMPFAWNSGGTDEDGRINSEGESAGTFPDGRINEEDRSFQFNHMMTLGLVFYLPTDANIAE